MKINTALLAAACITIAFPSPAAQIPLHQAYIKKVINDVKVIDPLAGNRPAKTEDVIKDNLSVRTGIRSRCELLFQDDTLTRLGAETTFSFKPGTRNMTLGEGTMLLQVPKDHGGAIIRAASVSASITGTTIMIEHLVNASIKVLVLEGSLKLSVIGRVGENINLSAGEMVIMKPDAKRLPNAVRVDLRKLMKTSSLINPNLFKGTKSMKVEPLPSINLIESAADKQDAQRKSGELVETNLAILGNGSKAVPLDSTTTANLENVGAPVVATVSTDGTQPAAGASATERPTVAEVVPAQIAIATSSEGQSIGQPEIISEVVTTNDEGQPILAPSGDGDVEGPAGSQSEESSGDSGEAPGENLPEPTGTGGGTDPLNTPGTTSLLINGDAKYPTGLLINGADGTLLTAPQSGKTVTIIGDEVFIKPGVINGVYSNGGNALAAATGSFGIGGDGGTVNIGTDSKPIAKDMIIESPIRATTGGNSQATAFGGTGGTVNIYGNAKILVKSDITVSGKTSARGGNILLDAKARIGDGITIENSGALLSLLDAAAPGPGGTITFRSAGSKITVKGTVAAERGTVDIQNRGGGPGAVTLDGAQLRGDVVKVGAIAPSGELIIKGGTLSADTTLGGAGAKIIAGKSVTINDSVNVDIRGGSAASVFTDNANYTGSGGNGTTSGQFTGAGAVTKPQSGRPGF